MRELRLFFMIGLAVGVLTGFALAQTKERVEKFATAKDAYAVWQNTADEAGRRAALEWMESNALACTPKDLSDALLNFGRAAAAGKSRDAFLSVCAKRGAPEATAADRQTVALQLSDWHSAAGEHEAALAVLNAHLQSADLLPTLRGAAVNKAASILGTTLGRPADAAKLFEEAIALYPPEKEPAFVADMANARAAILLTALHDQAGAEAETRRVLALGDACPSAAYGLAADRLAALLSATGRTNEAADALSLVIRHVALPPVGCARKLIDAGLPSAQMEEALVLLRARLAAPFPTPAELQTRIERIQPEAVELLLALGRAEEAVRECRVYALSASDRVYPQAVELAARCLKALDGNLGRANALLEFHASVPPPAGSVNPLFAFPALADPTRAETARQAERPPTDWTGWLNRAALLGWLDRPVDSMEAARAAFACCPMASNTLQTCANAVARPVLVGARDPALGQRLTDFLLVGAVGPDGRAGTPDDIADPFPEARKRLAYGLTAEAAKP